MPDYRPKATISLKSKDAKASVEVKKMPATDATKKTDDKKVGSLDQQRAAYAWQCVQGCNGDYTNLAKAAPALIMTNGLMQALAFYKGKGKEHHLNLNQHICGWLHQRGSVSQTDFANVMATLHGSDAATFRLATEETLALLKWIRQFAAAVNG